MDRQNPATVEEDSERVRQPGTHPPRAAHLSSTLHAIAGLGAGTFSTVALHPLDVIKTRLQVQGAETASGIQRPRYKGTWDAFRRIVVMEGFPGLYQGLSASILASGIGWGVYLWAYNLAKNYMEDWGVDRQRPAVQMTSATAAGLVTLFVTNPIFVVKTRMTLQLRGPAVSSLQLPPDHLYTSVTDAFVKISRREGMRGLYRGVVPSLAGVLHGVAQFLAYEHMKRVMELWATRGRFELKSYHYLGAGAASKVFATVLSYPYQVIRSRIQDVEAETTSVLRSTVLVFQREGVIGFYRGLWPTVLRVTPAAALMFWAYEELLRLMTRHAGMPHG